MNGMHLLFNSYLSVHSSFHLQKKAFTVFYERKTISISVKISTDQVAIHCRLKGGEKQPFLQRLKYVSDRTDPEIFKTRYVDSILIGRKQWRMGAKKEKKKRNSSSTSMSHYGFYVACLQT